jgi:nitroreductase
MRREKFVLLSLKFMSTTAAVPSSTLLGNLNWRYATKMFDASKTIPAETWKTLEEALILSPSSFGVQPWKFIVVTDKATREKLLPHSWGQTQVTQCSHYVIFAALTKIDEAYIDANLARTAVVRGVPTESLGGFRKMLVDTLIKGNYGTPEWAARQVYIALGNFMTCAAMLNIDTCPMEGFIPAEYDKILGLPAKGLASIVCCAAGYRDPDCKYASLPKVRFPASTLIEHI